MDRKSLMGAVAIIAVPAAIAGGYFLPHPQPEHHPEYFDLPPASITEMPEEAHPNRALPPHPIKDPSVVRL